MIGRYPNLGRPAARPKQGKVVGWWPLLVNTYGGNTAFDATDSKINGTITASPKWGPSPTPGIGSLLFDGSSNYVSMLACPTTNVSDWTISCWLNPTSINQNGLAIYNSNDLSGYGFGINNGAGSGTGAVLTALFGNVAWFNSGYSFPAANQWYFVEFGRDSGGTSRFWVNGVPTSSTSSSTPLTLAGARFSIGMEFSSGNAPQRFFAGRIGSVRVDSKYMGGSVYAEAIAGYPNTLSRWQRQMLNTSAAPASSGLLLKRRRMAA